MKKIKNILKIVIITTIVLLALQINVNAVITSTDKVVETGENVTITIKSGKALGAYTINLTDAGGLTLISSSGDQVSADYKTISGSSTTGITNLGTYTFKTPSVSKDTKYNVKFIIKGMETPELESLPDESNTATITVKAKQTTPDPTPTPTPEPEPTPTPEPEKPTEPTFTDTNKTMYSTGNINLRTSWSTSSSATSIEKGTELTVTGTSKEKVNGYVWYRVSYNGQTKDVASNLLTSTKPEEETKSDNANLKSLVVENFDIIPNFSSDVTEYTLDVTGEVNELTIKAEPEDSKATVTIKGEKELKDGENTIIISVDAEDGTTKLYEIKVTKKEGTTFGLTSLKIKDANIEFKPDVYNYSINVKSDVDILEIQAVASEEGAIVEITGNEELKEGENIITIIVSSKDEEEKATYQIKATKEAVKEEKTPRNVQSNSKIYIYAGIGAVALIALIIVIVYTVKHRNEDDSEKFEGFPDELPEKDDNQEIDDTEKVKNVDLEEKKNNKEEREEIDRKNYFLDAQSEDDYEEPRKRRGKHF